MLNNLQSYWLQFDWLQSNGNLYRSSVESSGVSPLYQDVVNVFPDNPPILIIIQEDKHHFGTMVAEILFCDPRGDISKFLTANANTLQKMDGISSIYVMRTRIWHNVTDSKR